VFDTHPLSAIMIIFIALLNDLPIMMIAYDNMPIHKNPVTWDMKEILVVAVAVAVIGVISSFGLYWIGARFWHLDFAHLQTLSFMAILCGGNLTIYLTRNAGLVWVRPLPEWKFMCATMFSLVVGTFASVYGLGTSDFVGIGWGYVGMSWAYIAVWFIFLMFFKAGLYKMLGHKAEYHTSYLDKQVDKHMGQVGLK
jgi:H+-transporting ATPase